jgi:hypothetical protein
MLVLLMLGNNGHRECAAHSGHQHVNKDEPFHTAPTRSALFANGRSRRGD